MGGNKNAATIFFIQAGYTLLSGLVQTVVYVAVATGKE
jgi:hypothetical protein